MQNIPERLLGPYMLMQVITQSYADTPDVIVRYSQRVQQLGKTMCNKYHSPNNFPSSRFVPGDVSAYKDQVDRTSQIRAFHAFYIKRCPVAMQSNAVEQGHVLQKEGGVCELCGLDNATIDEAYILKFQHVFSQHFFAVHSPKFVPHLRLHEDTVDISTKYQHNDLI